MTRMYGYADVAEQAWMLLDEARVSAYARAIAATVRPGDVVLDVGSGSGLLALLAARAGARRVYAVERSAMIELVRRHIEENGLGGVVEAVHADLVDLHGLPEAPRVVVSEMLGHFAPAEQQHRVYRMARRLARPDAVLIPASYQLAFAAARPRALERELAQLADVAGVRLGALVERLAGRVTLARLAPDDLVGAEVRGEAITIDAPLPTSFTARVPVAVTGPVTAICVSFVATLAPGVELSTGVGASRTHWLHTVFPVHPALDCTAGELLDVELLPRVVTDRGTWAWRVSNGTTTRRGDALRLLLGDKAAVLEQLGLRVPSAGLREVAPRLREWAAILDGGVDHAASLEALAQRLLARAPLEYPGLEEARQAVAALLVAAAKG